MAIRVVVERCPQNHPCPAVVVCPVGALSQEGHKAPTVDEDACIDCGKCSDFCPRRALVLEK
jgi:ferredoxin